MQPRSSHVLPLAALLLPPAMLWLLPQWTVDDAFISYRYGANLFQFGELTWNPGEPAVEGYTGVLLPLLTAFFLWVGAPVLISVKILSALAGCGTALLLNSGLKKLDVSIPVRALALGLYLLSPLLYMHLSSGLETTIFTFLIFTAFYLHFHLISEPTKVYSTILYLIALVVLSLARPEGALAAALSLGGLSLSNWKAGRKLQAIVLPLLWLLPALLYFCWRLDYYGEWLPNSFAAKRHPGALNVESVKAAGRFFTQYLLLPAAAAGLLWLVHADRIAGRGNRDRSMQRTAVLAFIFAGACLLAYLRADLFMNYASRFFAPFFPLLLWILGVTAARGWEAFQASREQFPRRSGLILRLLAVMAVLQVALFAFKWKGELAFVRYYSSIVEDEYLPAAQLLLDRLPPHSTVICYMDAGAIPYYTGFRTIDFGRLNDPFLARQRPGQNAVLDYFFAQDAEGVVMTSEAADRYEYLDEAMAIVEDKRFSKYKLIKVFGNRADFPYFQWVFVRSNALR